MTTCMDLERIMLSEISQTEKDKYCILLTWGILKNIYKINEETKPDKNQQVGREQNSGYQRGRGRVG